MNRQCAYNVTWWRVREITFAMEIKKPFRSYCWNACSCQQYKANEYLHGNV